MGLTLFFMFHLCDVDLVVVAVRSQPLDPDDALVEIDSNHQPIAVAPDIEYDPFGRNDTRSRVESLDVSCISPTCPAHFGKPRVERRLQSGVILVPRTRRNKLAKSPPRNDTHNSI